MSIGESPVAARRQAGLSATQVSQRTSSGETIIRGIDRVNFSACGCDFYACGHVRAIAGQRARTLSRWSPSTTPATACRWPVPLPTFPARSPRSGQGGCAGRTGSAGHARGDHLMHSTYLE
ncbi:MAG: helix-turn-helix domain-containing protein [Streptosporangiaceae bacterium]